MNAISGGDSFHSPSQMSLIDVIFPGFSMVSTSAHQLLAGNLDSYTQIFCTFGMFVLFTRYAVNYVWRIVRSYFSSYVCCYIWYESDSSKPPQSMSHTMTKHTTC